MALIPRDKLTELVTAEQAKSTAESAAADIQLQAVAYAINCAANTGETRTEFKETMLPETKSALEAKGYKVQFIGQAVATAIALISWSE